MTARIGIIGSGVAGLSCARRLSEAGFAPVVFDKGRGIGGRLATRRGQDGVQFDHGAQYMSADDAAFADVLRAAEAQGAVAQWELARGKWRYVGTPGMTAFAKYLGHGLDIRQNAEVTSVSHDQSRCELHFADDVASFDVVVSTAPAPQTDALIGGALAQSLSSVRYDPCLTLMVALSKRPQLPATSKLPTPDIAWIARDSAKPGRPDTECWVVQAGALWSQRYLEQTKDDICANLLTLFLDYADVPSSEVIFATAHRWRYAQVSTPLGEAFCSSKDATLYAGGDWCLGPNVMHAWASGRAIADDILARQ